MHPEAPTHPESNTPRPLVGVRRGTGPVSSAAADRPLRLTVTVTDTTRDHPNTAGTACGRSPAPAPALR